MPETRETKKRKETKAKKPKEQRKGRKPGLKETPGSLLKLMEIERTNKDWAGLLRFYIKSTTRHRIRMAKLPKGSSRYAKMEKGLQHLKGATRKLDEKIVGNELLNAIRRANELAFRKEDLMCKLGREEVASMENVPRTAVMELQKRLGKEKLSEMMYIELNAMLLTARMDRKLVHKYLEKFAHPDLFKFWVDTLRLRNKEGEIDRRKLTKKFVRNEVVKFVEKAKEAETHEEMEEVLNDLLDRGITPAEMEHYGVEFGVNILDKAEELATKGKKKGGMDYFA